MSGTSNIPGAALPLPTIGGGACGPLPGRLVPRLDREFKEFTVARLENLANNKADLVSPAFTGTPTAPTAAQGDSSTKIATTAFVAGETSGKYATKADATLTLRFTEWVISPDYNGYYLKYDEENDGWQLWYRTYSTHEINTKVSHVNKGNALSTSVLWSADEVDTPFGFSATRQFIGYTMGTQADKPLASEAEAEALRTAITAISPDWTSGSSYAQYDVVKYNGVYYYAKSAINDSSAVPSLDPTWGLLANLAALAHLFLPLTGGAITGTLTVKDSGGGGCVSVQRPSAFLGGGRTTSFLYDKIVCEGATPVYLYFPANSGTFALFSDIGIPAFDAYEPYDVGAKVVYSNAVWNCKTAVSTYGAWTGATNWDKLFDLAVDSEPIANSGSLMTSGAIKTALDAKANASDLRYAISESIALTVTSGATATTLADRTYNVRTVAAPGSGNTTTITATLPPIVAGKSRDMFLNLTVGTQASDEGDISLSIVEPTPAGGLRPLVVIDFGSVDEISIGKNLILLTEIAPVDYGASPANTHWLITVKHEDFAS